MLRLKAEEENDIICQFLEHRLIIFSLEERMKKLFGKREEIEKILDEDDLKVINLDETAEWSKLDLAEELAKKRAVSLMEEIPDDEEELEELQDDDIEYLSDEEEEDEEEEAVSFRKRAGGFLTHWTVLDKVVAATGVIVLAVAIVTAAAYAVNRTVDKQIAAFAPVGEQLENIGVVGQDKLLAVADAKKAMMEAAKIEAEVTQQYVESEVPSVVKVVMKMTSVEKDLKIKFVNKKTGKLVGNIPFEVKITDGENKTYNKLDHDMDGIIYLTNLTAGNYKVSMVELSGVEDYSFSTATETIKVKDKIVYEKIDVTEEIKDQSEVDISKEDTAQKVETESVLTDTVEWVESTKKESNSQETYIQVNKDTIADPALSASLKLDLGILRVMQQSMLADHIATIDKDGGGGSVSGNNGGSETVDVTGLTLNSSAMTIEIGENGSLTATVKPDNATDKKVTWSSSNTSVATVDSNGKVTAEAAGTATITAKAGNVEATCTVTVPEKEITSIVINEKLSLKVGESCSLSVTIEPSDAADKSLKWTSDTTSVATVDGNGKVTAVAVGTAKIKVTGSNGKTAVCNVTVTENKISVTEVTLNKTTLELVVEGTETLTAAVKPDNASDKAVSWTSSDTAIATVDTNGKVTAVKEGTATITVTTKDAGKKAECKVTVKAKTTETGISLDKTSASMKVGDTLTLTAKVTPEGKKVIWKSSDESKATVDANGKVTAKAEGKVDITAAVENENKSATCNITVSKAYDAKNDTTTSLKDKSGNQIYVLVDGNYVEAKVADYYKHSTFYKKEKVSQYTYTGWQNLDGRTYYFDKNGNKVTGEQIIQGAKYSFNSDGTLNTGSGILGIDVSTWNGSIDWNKVKNSGVSYVIIRTGFRGSTQGALVEDNRFRQNIQGATNAGLKVGVYFFSQAVNEVEAVEEASMVLSQVKGYHLAYPVFIDVEPSGGRADGLSSGDRTKVINAFCQTIQNGGLKAGIYANKTWLAQKMNISALSGYKIWLAQYNSTVTYGGRYDMWQYSDKGTVAGINGKVDMNLSYLSY